jgi:hypothetical protein
VTEKTEDLNTENNRGTPRKKLSLFSLRPLRLCSPKGLCADEIDVASVLKMNFIGAEALTRSRVAEDAEGRKRNEEKSYETK